MDSIPEEQQPAEAHDDIEQLKQLLAQHGTRLVVVVTVLLIVIAATLLYKSHRRRQVEQAVQMLGASHTSEDL